MPHFQSLLAVKCSIFINDLEFIINNKVKNFSEFVIFVQICVILREKTEEELDHGI